MQLFLVAISTVLAIMSPLSYIVSIVRGTSRPHRLTRFALCAVLALNFFSIHAAHGNIGAQLLAGIFAAQAFIVFVLSLWHGEGGKSRLDWLCLVIAAAGLIGWQTTGDAVVGMWFSILADFAAYVPAVRKTWRDPASESHWTYTLSLCSALCGLIAFPFGVGWIFQAYIIAIDGLMVACIYRERFWPVRMAPDAADLGSDGA